MTIHAGINRRAVEAFMREGRRMNIVSRGGSLLFAWMKMTGNENPFFEYYDEVLDILRRYDVTISLGDALRPGCIDDASDAGQISELIELGNLAQRAWAKDVQVMIEGPGHMAMNEIAANMQMEKRLCHGAPFYVLGPLVTDIAPGYDHITSAIGGAIAAQAGANFLCYVTPAEHLRLPDENDVREGIVASKIAAHAADIALGLPGARERDNAMADARHKLDWPAQFALALDPEKAERFYNQVPPTERHTCSMCGKMCAVRTTNMILEGKKSNSARKRAHADASEYKRAVGETALFAVCLNWACAEWRIENGEWKMNAMAECCVGGQWPPLRLSVCKSLETVRCGHTPGHLLWPFG